MHGVTPLTAIQEPDGVKMKEGKKQESEDSNYHAFVVLASSWEWLGAYFRKWCQQNK
jgi:hypothetical protein